MKKILYLLIILGLTSGYSYAEDIVLDDYTPTRIEIPKNNVPLKGSLMVSDEAALEEIIKTLKI